MFGPVAIVHQQRHRYRKIEFLMHRLLRWGLVTIVPYALLFFVAFPAMNYCEGAPRKWDLNLELFQLFGLGLFSVVGLFTTLFWLFDGYRLTYIKKLNSKRRAAQKKREPCRLSQELGLAEIDEQVKSQPSSDYRLRMRKFLAEATKTKTGNASSKLWEANGLENGFYPPRPASFFRRLLLRIRQAIARE